MNWILLVIAGLFEVAFAACLGKAKESTGIETAYWYTGFLVCLGISIPVDGISGLKPDLLPDF